MRSDCRGVARGTAPKRSKSARGPPVCMSSIAQQAKPNSMYHWDDTRPQLSRSSTFVVKTVSGSELISGFMTFLPKLSISSFDSLYPVQVTLGPRVNQAEKKNAHENQYFDQSKDAYSALHPAPEHRRHREDKCDFDFENDKNQ